MEVVNQGTEVVLTTNGSNATTLSSGLFINNRFGEASGKEDGSVCEDLELHQSSCVLAQYGFNYNNNYALETLEEVPEDGGIGEITNGTTIQENHQFAEAERRDGEAVAGESGDSEADGANYQSNRRKKNWEERETITDGNLRREHRQQSATSQQKESLLTAEKPPTSSPKDWRENSSSSKSSNNRVTFTEEFPSQSGNYKRVTTSTSATAIAIAMTAKTLTPKQPDEGKGSETAARHITISEDFPTLEDRAFRTKIDSFYEGWDNPFRPEGEISHDAEELLRLWREGKLSADAAKNVDSVGKDEPPEEEGEPNSPLQKNGTNGKNGCKTFEVTRETAPGSMMASNPKTVILDTGNCSKKKAKGCCSLM